MTISLLNIEQIKTLTALMGLRSLELRIIIISNLFLYSTFIYIWYINYVYDEEHKVSLSNTFCA